MKLITVLVQDQDAATAVSLLAEIAVDLKMSTPDQPAPPRAQPARRVNRVAGKTAAELVVEALTAGGSLSLKALQDMMKRHGYAPTTLSGRLSELEKAGVVTRYSGSNNRPMYKLPLSVQAAAQGL